MKLKWVSEASFCQQVLWRARLYCGSQKMRILASHVAIKCFSASCFLRSSAYRIMPAATKCLIPKLWRKILQLFLPPLLRPAQSHSSKWLLWNLLMYTLSACSLTFSIDRFASSQCARCGSCRRVSLSMQGFYKGEGKRKSGVHFGCTIKIASKRFASGLVRIFQCSISSGLPFAALKISSLQTLWPPFGLQERKISLPSWMSKAVDSGLQSCTKGSVVWI